MSEEKQSFMESIKANLAIIIAIATVIGIISSFAVTYDKVGDLVVKVEKIIIGQTESHDDIDILKIRIVQELYEVKIEAMKERHELENKINQEKVERLESELEFYKNK